MCLRNAASRGIYPARVGGASSLGFAQGRAAEDFTAETPRRGENRGGTALEFGWGRVVLVVGRGGSGEVGGRGLFGRGGVANIGGFGFVSHGRVAQNQEVVEGALVHQVEARLVAVQKGELRGGGEIGIGAGDAGQFAGFGALLHAGGEKLRLDRPGAAETPVGGGHFLDHAEFDFVDRGEALEVEVQQLLEGFAGFAADDHAVGKQTMTDRIAGGAGLAFPGDGASRPRSVEPGGLDAFLRNYHHSGHSITRRNDELRQVVSVFRKLDRVIGCYRVLEYRTTAPDLSESGALAAGQRSLAADATCVGRPVVDLLRRANLGCALWPVLITGGHTESSGQGFYHVPKRDLIIGLQVLLQRGALQIAAGLAHGEALVREMAEMRVRVTGEGREQYGVWREGEHDDLVLAVALACWGLRRVRREVGCGERTRRLL